MMTIYYVILGVAFVAALWLNVRALPHLCALLAWLGLACLLDEGGAYELKLFLDFFAFHALLVLTIGNVTKGRPSKPEVWCTKLAGAQVLLSAVAYGSSYILAFFHLPQGAFDVLQNTLWVGLNALFLACVLVFLWGVNIRERVADTLRGLRSLGLRHTRLFAPQKAYGRTIAQREHSA